MAKVIVSCADPFVVYATETHVKILLGFQDSELLGRSVLCLCGPWSDRQKISSLILGAKNGAVSKAALSLCNKYGDPWDVVITSAPYRLGTEFAAILLFEGDGITCDLIPETFPGQPPAKFRKENCQRTTSVGYDKKECKCVVPTHFSKEHVPQTNSVTNASDSSSHNKAGGLLRLSNHRNIRSINDVSAADLHHTENPPTVGLDSHGLVKVNPRRKRGEYVPPAPAQQVTVSLDLLKHLQQFPIQLAAAQIGISSTALKHACRKLGVHRWEYRRAPGVPAPPHRPAPGPAARPCSDSDRRSGRILNDRLPSAPGHCLGPAGRPASDDDPLNLDSDDAPVDSCSALSGSPDSPAWAWPDADSDWAGPLSGPQAQESLIWWTRRDSEEPSESESAEPCVELATFLRSSESDADWCCRPQL